MLRNQSMDDLSSLDWNVKPSTRSSGNQAASQPLPLRPTPSPSHSGRSTPLSAHLSTSKAPATQSQTAKSQNNDSFSNLLAPNPAKPLGSLSLLEKQKQLQAQGSTRSVFGQQQLDPYSINDNQFWEGLGSGRGTPISVSSP